MGCIVGIQDAFEARNEFPEEFQALRAQFDRQIGDPGNVAAGPGEALDQAQPHRIFDPGEDNRNLGGRLLRRFGRLCGRDKEEVYAVAHQLVRGDGQEGMIPLREADAYHEILALAIA
jgi:hypothetical protein